MRVKLIGILLLTVFLQEKSSAQAIDIAEIDQLTAKAMKHLTTFSRYAYKTKMYGDMEFGKNVGSETSSAYFGQNTGILHIFAVVQIEKKSEEKLGIWINNDQQITTKDANASTVIIRLDIPWVSQKESDAFASFRNNMGLGHFVFPASANKYGHSLNPDSFPYEELRNTTTSIIESTYQSRPCYKVLVTTTLNSSLKPISTEYLLDKQHGMVLAQRQKGVYSTYPRDLGI